MKKIYLLFSLLFLTFSFRTVAQSVLLPQPATLESGRKCFTAEYLQQFNAAHPGAESTEQFENWIKQKINQRKVEKAAGKIVPALTIPMVFHIIHNTEPEGSGRNISEAFIQQQVLQLNKDFANLSNSPYAVSEDMGIQFVLARDNPSGSVLPQPGIDRIDRVTKGWTAPPYTVGYANLAQNYLTNTIKPNSIWDPSRYLNIWVTEYEAGILGIATFPGSSTLAGLNNSETDLTAGVAIDFTTVGSLFAPKGCGAYGKGRTLTHELGHFFGLRHIWGDGNCATDYCGDTPTHQTANNGVPTHPKPNTCGTPDEMFENYMDYTDDIVTNTFTVNQGDRMEAVIANSPRRASLGTSNVGFIPVTGTNKISFNNCSGLLTISEAGITGTTQRYKDLDLYLNVEGKASGTATITINAVGSANAVLNRNYQLLTPTLSFNTGDDYKPVGLRIIDNAEADGDKTITLTYTISGSGVTAGTAAQSMVITILDDDNLIVGQSPFNIIDEDFSAGVIPTGWSSLISTGNLNNFNVSANGDAGGTGPAAHITNDNTLKPNTYTSTAPAGSAVLRSPLINPLSVKSIGTLNFKYKIRGRNNSDFGYTLFTIPGSSSLFFWGTVTGANGYGPYSSNTKILANSPSLAFPANIGLSKFALNYYFATDGTGFGVDPGLNVDDITLAATPFGVETAISSSYGYTVNTGNTNLNTFRSSANNNIIAGLRNPSQTISGIQASVLAEGTTRTAITTTGVGGFRADKVVRISPAVANTTASYEVTLYFTAAELAAWGAEIPTLKIMKLTEGTYSSNNYSPANSSLLTTVFGDQSAKGYYTYTGTVSGTGFSDFILVSSAVVLPVGLLDFTATPQKNSIKLNWSTSEEINNKGFGVERSVDGSTYQKIGWVNGKGSSSNNSDYIFTDNFVAPGVTYYYRLRQTDNDLKEKISVVRQARTDGGREVVITLTPNPAKDQVKIFIAGGKQPAKINMTDAQGRIVKSWKNVNTATATTNLNISGLASGIYTFTVEMADQKITQKIIVL